MFNFIQKQIIVENISQQTVGAAVSSSPLFQSFGVTPDMVSLESIGGGQVYKIIIDIPGRHVDSDLAGNVVTMLQLEQGLAGVNFGQVVLMGHRFPYKPAKFVSLAMSAISIRFTYSINVQIPPELETMLVTQHMNNLPADLSGMYEEFTHPVSKSKLMENAIDTMIVGELKLGLGSKALLKKTLGYTGDNHLAAAIATMRGSKMGEKVNVEMGFPVFYGASASIGRGDYINLKTLLNKEIGGVLQDADQELLTFNDHGIRFLDASSGRGFELVYTFSYRRA
jgi:hypothetical protein